jgi:protein SCO1/2
MNTKNTQTKKSSSTLLVVIVALLSIAAGIVINQNFLSASRDTQAPPGLDATVLPEARPIAGFQLTDHHGKSFSAENMKGKWSFLFFGFTNCPDVCPTTLKIMQGVWKKLPADKDKPNMLFFSVDPDRDPPELLKSYVTYYHPEFIGITGKLDQIDIITNQLGILYGYDDKEGNPEDYTVNHSAQILLTDPQGRMRAVFSPPYDAESISHALNMIRDFYEG